MTVKTLMEVATALAAPFGQDEIAYKPAKGGGTKKLPYIKAPAIMDRLDRIAGAGNWAQQVEVADAESGTVKVTLTVLGVTMSAFGDPNNPKGGERGVGGQVFKEAESDGLKRAARLFGIGRYLWQSGAAPTSAAAVVPQAAQQPAVSAQPQTTERPPRPDAKLVGKSEKGAAMWRVGPLIGALHNGELISRDLCARHQSRFVLPLSGPANWAHVDSDGVACEFAAVPA